MASPTVASLSTALAALTVRVDSLEKLVAANHAGVAMRIAAAESNVAALSPLSAQVVGLEKLAAANEGRIAALEEDMATHKEGAVERQANVDRLRAETERIRWATRNGRMDIL